ncbi:MAG: dienelactone hydrolase family protein [Thaumarchaeota archaeon]|nr:dienelactone hydrolase family protein [Nitrososphaerota archaeon]
MKDGFMKYGADGERPEAYVSNPRSSHPSGQVIVIHEVWGFTPFIQRVCERLSHSGFLAVAPLLYWRDKELFSPTTLREGLDAVWDLSLEERYRPAKLAAAMREKRPSKEAESMLKVLYDMGFRKRILQDVTSLADSLKTQSAHPRIGVLGFSMGGKLAIQLAAGFPGLLACVAYSAKPADSATVKRIQCPVQLFYGKDDLFMTRDLPEFVKDSMRNAAELALKIYPQAGHEFFDETNRGYQAAAAMDAWGETVDFFRRKLSGKDVKS